MLYLQLPYEQLRDLEPGLVAEVNDRKKRLAQLKKSETSGSKLLKSATDKLAEVSTVWPPKCEVLYGLLVFICRFLFLFQAEKRLGDLRFWKERRMNLFGSDDDFDDIDKHNIKRLWRKEDQLKRDIESLFKVVEYLLSLLVTVCLFLLLIDRFI